MQKLSHQENLLHGNWHKLIKLVYIPKVTVHVLLELLAECILDCSIKFETLKGVENELWLRKRLTWWLKK